MTGADAPAPERCPERDRLASEYVAALRAYCLSSRAVLTGSALGKSEFEHLMEQNRRAHEECAAAKEAMETHRLAHGC